MSYRIEPQETLSPAIRRIADEQIGKALDEIRDDELDTEATVHQVRKRCKKLRGLARLIRPDFTGSYQNENKRFRDIARTIASARDARVMLETLKTLLDRDPPPEVHDAQTVVDQFKSRVQPSYSEREAADTLARVAQLLERARTDVRTWAVKPDAEAALPGGFARTYRRARRAMANARTSTTAADWHDWRKRAKYHWYHTRLLRNVWPKVMKARAKETSLLSDILGDAHDFSVLREALMTWRTTGGPEPELTELVHAAEAARHDLRLDALPLGARLFGECTERIADRMGALMDIVHRPAEDTGALTELDLEQHTSAALS